jgi:hypothetical protein
VREWLEDEGTDPADRSRFIDCFTSLGIVDATRSVWSSGDALARITRAAVLRNLDESLKHDPGLEPRPLELLKTLYGDLLPIAVAQASLSSLTVETCTDPSFLASLHSLFVIVKSGDQDPRSAGFGGEGQEAASAGLGHRTTTPAPPLVVNHNSQVTPVDGFEERIAIDDEGLEGDIVEGDGGQDGAGINEYEVSVDISDGNQSSSSSSSRQPPLPGGTL